MAVIAIRLSSVYLFVFIIFFTTVFANVPPYAKRIDAKSKSHAGGGHQCEQKSSYFSFLKSVPYSVYGALTRALSATEIVALAASVALALWAWHYFSEIRRYPRGPWPLPIIGNLHQIDKAYPHRSMVKWQQKYGSVFTVWLPKPAIVVAEWKELQRLLLGAKGERCLDRPASFVYGIFTEQKPGGDGIILCSGAKWRSQRRFALTAFKNFGMGGSRMEERINLHKDELLARLANAAAVGDDGTPRCGAKTICNSSTTMVVDDIHAQLAFCFGNVIHDLVMGRHYAFDDPEFLCFKNHIDSTLRRVTSVPMLIIDCYPWTRFLFPLYYRYVRDGYAIQRFFLDEIERHARALDISAAPTNFIDAYLQDMYREEDLHLSKLTLALDAGDLWTGGLETVVTTLTWAVIYLIHHPRVQRNLHAELDAVLAGEPFKMSDRQRLPYLRATVDELQRIVNVLPWHIPHAMDTTTELRGKTIPKGATILPQFGAVHFNETLFPNPEFFWPERFLRRNDSSGPPLNTVPQLPDDDFESCHHHPSSGGGGATDRERVEWKYVPSEYLAPFGIGKRACLGEGLARMELYIVFAALLQNFRFESIREGELPSLQRSPGMTSKPQPFKCRISRRNPTKLITSYDVKSNGE